MQHMSRQSIRENAHKIKYFVENFFTNKDILMMLLVIIVALASFALGILSERDRHKPHPKTLICTKAHTTDHSIRPIFIGGAVVASWKGKKYHYPWCPGATHMSEKNKRWFKSIDEARSYGYTPAGNCKGLQ